MNWALGLLIGIAVGLAYLGLKVEDMLTKQDLILEKLAAMEPPYED